MGLYYILDGKTPVACSDILAWARWVEKENHRVAEDKIGDVRVSTIFLGLDHNMGRENEPPLLFETMVFGGSLDQEQERCSTWEQAEEMHRRMCDRVKEKIEGGLTDESSDRK